MEKFLNDIEDFLLGQNITPTVFGVMTMKDPTFVFRLRKGCGVTIRTMERVTRFMNNYKQQEK